MSWLRQIFSVLHEWANLWKGNALEHIRYLFQFLRPLRSGEMWNMWFEEIEVRGSHKSHGSFLSQYPPPFLSNMHPKVCIFWWWCLWWGSIHCSAHPGWDKKRDDDGFCFISCFLFKAQARSLFHRDLFILSWCSRLTCSKYRTQVWSLYCLALSLTHSVHNVVSKVVQSPNQVEVSQLMFNSLFSLRVKPKVVLALG